MRSGHWSRVGRIAVNRSPTSAQALPEPWLPTSWHILQDQLRLLPTGRGGSGAKVEKGAAGSCAWGSFRSAANPVLRGHDERVVIASKGRFDRALRRTIAERRGACVGEHDRRPGRFMAATLDVWDIEPESARRVSHPAPFPVGLPLRLISNLLHLRSTTSSSIRSWARDRRWSRPARRDRRYVGYDLDPTYVEHCAPGASRDEAGATTPRTGGGRAASGRMSTRPTTFRPASPRKARRRKRSPRSCSSRWVFTIVAKNKRLARPARV